MPQEVTLTLANPSPSACPADITELFVLIRQALSGSVPEALTSYVVQAATPNVNQQALIWFKLDGAGRPLGVYKYYSAGWRRVYNGVLGELKIFSGDPAAHFDATGKGAIGGEWDGWALANGQNGTHNITDKFLCSAHLDESGGVTKWGGGGWQTIVTGAPLRAGGVKDITLNDANTYQEARPEIKVWRWRADGNTGRVTGGNLYGNESIPGQSAVLQSADAGNPTPPAIPTVPPFVAVGICQFVGYS